MDTSEKREVMSSRMFIAISSIAIILIVVVLLLALGVIKFPDQDGADEPEVADSEYSLKLEDAMKSVVDINISWEEDDLWPSPDDKLQRSGKGVILSAVGNTITIATTPWVLGIEEFSNSEVGGKKIELNYYNIDCYSVLGDMVVNRIGYSRNDSCLAFLQVELLSMNSQSPSFIELEDYLSSAPILGDTLKILVSGETRSLIVVALSNYDDPETNYYGAYYIEIDQALDEPFSGGPLFLQGEDGMRWVGLLEKPGRIVLRSSNYIQTPIIWYDNTREGIADCVESTYGRRVSLQ